MMNMISGPFTPHSPFLDVGIDSLTIKATFIFSKSNSSTRINKEIASFINNIERTIHALSNLHERLHHSVFQYILLSPTKFVLNGEYIFPLICILLPVLIRGVLVVLFSDDKSICYHLQFFQLLLLLIFFLSMTSLPIYIFSHFNFTLQTSNSTMLLHSIFALWYLILLFIFKCFMVPKIIRLCQIFRRKLHFVLWVTCVYAHAPIAIFHYSLAFLSALFLSPILAVHCDADKQTKFHLIYVVILFSMAWVPILILPIDSPFFCFLYSPILFLLIVYEFREWNRYKVA